MNQTDSQVHISDSMIHLVRLTAHCRGRW